MILLAGCKRKGFVPTARRTPQNVGKGSAGQREAFSSERGQATEAVLLLVSVSCLTENPASALGSILRTMGKGRAAKRHACGSPSYSSVPRDCAITPILQQ